MRSLDVHGAHTLQQDSFLGAALMHLNRLDEPELLLRGSLADLRLRMPAGAWWIASAQSLVGALRSARARYDEAASLLTNAIMRFLPIRGPTAA